MRSSISSKDREMEGDDFKENGAFPLFPSHLFISKSGVLHFKRNEKIFTSIEITSELKFLPR